ncbi:hypothetical protein LELG_05719 [Lodderomyces elongisporus NRRL YB-4239]|uniref:Trafficking protein particle complex subunit n=1 Tax=Lodderomyces elongisporus (strain ATCC 11503 / CBS 2605 / JCM 1781 / NBRC 1676 / NRRL YB-4239) TaxID=379508 RepID=A5E7Y0_LODEL|nr:hypothetical protein LELG_05719 [Lodderomyces elongisporus NRRL YB-4239]
MASTELQQGQSGTPPKSLTTTNDEAAAAAAAAAATTTTDGSTSVGDPTKASQSLPHPLPPLPKPSPIQFISIISRTDRPLYIQSFLSPPNSSINSTDPQSMNRFLKFNFLSHMALDIFSSPTSLSLRQEQFGENADNDSSGVLQLFIQDQVIVYGYESNNGLKIIVGVDQSIQVEMNKLRLLIMDVYRLYLKVICNPFRNFTKPMNGYQSIEVGEGEGEGEGEQDEEERILLKLGKFDDGIKKLVLKFK